jgi:hypothetical protein
MQASIVLVVTNAYRASYRLYRSFLSLENIAQFSYFSAGETRFNNLSGASQSLNSGAEAQALLDGSWVSVPASVSSHCFPCTEAMHASCCCGQWVIFLLESSELRSPGNLAQGDSLRLWPGVNIKAENCFMPGPRGTGKSDFSPNHGKVFLF